jgi:RNA polymerase sigma-70 factor (ECF subfamily)
MAYTGADVTATDARLVARCRAGEPAAWNELVERFSRYVLAIATQVFRLSQDDAEDVFQEVFTQTFRHLHTLRDDEAIRPWIAQMTRNLAVDRLRSSAREAPSEQLPEEVQADRVLERIDQALDVHCAMERLPEHCHEILDRFFTRDESYRTIGEALQIPPGTIASRISRCLRKLRVELQGR